MRIDDAWISRNWLKLAAFSERRTETALRLTPRELPPKTARSVAPRER
jgi:hypothetical protein